MTYSTKSPEQWALEKHRAANGKKNPGASRVKILFWLLIAAMIGATIWFAYAPQSSRADCTIWRCTSGKFPSY